MFLLTPVDYKVKWNAEGDLAPYSPGCYSGEISLNYADEILHQADDDRLDANGQKPIIKAFSVIKTTPGWVGSTETTEYFANVNLPPNFARFCVRAVGKEDVNAAILSTQASYQKAINKS